MSSIHYKQTRTGLYTNFSSNLPNTYKNGTFTGLLFRIYSICSNWSIINDELTKLRKMFLVHCYPTYLLDKCVNQFLSKINNSCNKTHAKQKQGHVVSLPFCGVFMFKYRKSLCKIVKQYF